MEYRDILDRLYSDYYLYGRSSDVTSSHWKRHGELSTVLKKGDNYDLSGVGFGNFIHRSMPHYIKHSLEILLAKSLFKQYEVDISIRQVAREVVKKQNRIMHFDCVRQMLSADLLFKHDLLQRSKIITIIGDGYGFMASLVKMLCPEAIIISVNLGRVLIFDVFYTEKVFPQGKAILINEKEKLGDFKRGSIIFLEAEKYKYLFSLPIDLFINISSMCEMNMDVIRNYFNIMRSSMGESFFYCCNRIEKNLPDGAIIRFFDYPWREEDEVIIDELCPWYQKYPYRWPPFWRSFDGPIHHRLVKLASGR